MRSHHAPLLYVYKDVELRDYTPLDLILYIPCLAVTSPVLFSLRSVQLVTVLPVVLLALPTHYTRAPYSSH